MKPTYSVHCGYIGNSYNGKSFFTWDLNGYKIQTNLKRNELRQHFNVFSSVNKTKNVVLFVKYLNDKGLFAKIK